VRKKKDEKKEQKLLLKKKKRIYRCEVFILFFIEISYMHDGTGEKKEIHYFRY